MGRRLTYEEVKNTLKGKGLELLSKEYINNSTPIKIKCSKGHITESTFQSIQSSKNGCSECAGNKPYNIDYMKKYFEDRGCILLEENYINANTKMEYICECGENSKISFSKFKSGQRCKKCGSRKAGDKQKLNIEFLKLFFQNQGCILLSSDYDNNLSPLHFICKCGEKSITNWATFRDSKVCSKCGYQRIGEKIRKFDYEYIKRYLDEFGYMLLENEYKNPSTPMRCICPNGHETNVEFRHFQDGVRCRECYLLNNIGENNPNWNSNKTNEERLIERSYHDYRDWRNNIYQRDNYTCQCCGESGGRLNAHHLNGYHWAIDQRTDINNGITLCDKCHDDFHNTYGRINNTRKQFKEYLTGVFWNYKEFETI